MGAIEGAIEGDVEGAITFQYKDSSLRYMQRDKNVIAGFVY